MKPDGTSGTKRPRNGNGEPGETWYRWKESVDGVYTSSEVILYIGRETTGSGRWIKGGRVDGRKLLM